MNAPKFHMAIEFQSGAKTGWIGIVDPQFVGVILSKLKLVEEFLIDPRKTQTTGIAAHVSLLAPGANCVKPAAHVFTTTDTGNIDRIVQFAANLVLERKD